MNWLDRLIRNEEATTLVEYGLVIFFIAVACITLISLIGEQVVSLYTMPPLNQSPPPSSGDNDLTGA